MRNRTGGSADVCPQMGRNEGNAAFPSSIWGRAPRKAPRFVVSSSSEISPGLQGAWSLPSLTGWIQCWHTGLTEGFLSEKAVSIRHSPDSGLAQSTGSRFKSSHALEPKLGATLVYQCTGASVAKFWPIFPWPHTVFLPHTLGKQLSCQSL